MKHPRGSKLTILVLAVFASIGWLSVYLGSLTELSELERRLVGTWEFTSEDVSLQLTSDRTYLFHAGMDCFPGNARRWHGQNAKLTLDYKGVPHLEYKIVFIDHAKLDLVYAPDNQAIGEVMHLRRIGPGGKIESSAWGHWHRLLSKCKRLIARR